MSWTCKFINEGSQIEVIDPDGNIVGTVDNTNGIVNGVPVDAKSVIANQDPSAVLADKISVKF